MEACAKPAYGRGANVGAVADGAGPLRVGLMGGTFDPPHLGHLLAAEQARDGLGLDEVVFMPAGEPAFKQDSCRIGAEDRLAMTRLAVEGIEGWRASDLEVLRPGITYTADTLRRLRELLPSDARIFFIVGTDAAASMPAWKEPGVVAELAEIALVQRPGEADAASVAERLRQAGFRVHVVPASTASVSSSQVRRRIAEGRTVRFLVPDEVIRYIDEHGLYLQPEEA